MKRCKSEGCRNYVFSNLYCLNHQYKRTDSKYLDRKRMEKEQKTNPHARVNVMPAPIEHSFGYKDQTSMFLDMWHDAYVPGKGVICPFTGEKLDHYFRSQFFWNCFAHVLPKGRYTYWKYNPANIRIVFPVFHRIVDAGTLEERKHHPTWDFEAWDSLVLEKKEEYRKFKQDNLLA